MKKAIIGVVAGVALAGTAVASVPLIERHAAAQVKEQMQADGLTQVDDVKVGLFDRSVAFTNLRSKSPQGITASQWSLSGLAWPLGELLRGNTPFAGWTPGQPIRADHVAMKDARFSDGIRSWSAASLSIDGLDLQRYDPNPGRPPFEYLSVGARVLQAVAFRRLELRDFTYADPTVRSTFSVASVAMGDVDHGKYGSFLASGLQVPGAPGAPAAFRLDEIKIDGLDVRRLLTAMSSPAWRPGMPTGRINLVHAHATGFGGDLMTRYGVSLGSVTTDVTREGKDIAHTRSKIDGFVYAPPMRGVENLQARTVMAAMGVKEVRLALDCGGTEDRAKGEVRIDQCTFRGSDLAVIDFTAKAEKADAAFWAALDGQEPYGLARSTVVLSQAKLVLADKGLIDRAFKAMAMLSRQPADQARQSIAQEVRRFQPPGVLITDDLTKLLDTAARFVEKGGTLTVQANPDPPVGMDKIRYLMKPGPDLIDLLGITATLK